ncbi:hypothetical protein ACJX0J_019717 [Zea mays]
MLNGGGGGQKKRNTKIEPYRHRVETDPKFFDKSWRKLHDAIREIYNHNASGLSFEELYRTAYNMGRLTTTKMMILKGHFLSHNNLLNAVLYLDAKTNEKITAVLILFSGFLT